MRCFIGGNGFAGKDDEGGVKIAESVYGPKKHNGGGTFLGERAAPAWGSGKSERNRQTRVAEVTFSICLRLSQMVSTSEVS